MNIKANTETVKNVKKNSSNAFNLVTKTRNDIELIQTFQKDNKLMNLALDALVFKLKEIGNDAFDEFNPNLKKLEEQTGSSSVINAAQELKQLIFGYITRLNEVSSDIVELMAQKEVILELAAQTIKNQNEQAIDHLRFANQFCGHILDQLD
jgi:hypothetical protein